MAPITLMLVTDWNYDSFDSKGQIKVSLSFFRQKLLVKVKYLSLYNIVLIKNLVKLHVHNHYGNSCQVHIFAVSAGIWKQEPNWLKNFTTKN